MTLPETIAVESVLPVPWKNGTGSTRTLLCGPEGAGLDRFVWRVSVAEIAEPGPFSLFAGVDRVLALWRGDGVRLRSPAWPTITIDHASEPFRFAGEDEVWCELPGRTSFDLNLMLRRGRALGTMTPVISTEPLPGDADVHAVLCAEGRAELRWKDGSAHTVPEGHLQLVPQALARDCAVSAEAAPMRSRVYRVSVWGTGPAGLL